MKPKRVTQNDIAKSLNLSTQTVSMALRGHKRISESTRARVEGAAKKMGYTPDPTLAALAHYRTRQAHQKTKWERIALLHDWESEDGWLKHSHYKRLHTSLQNETKQRGIQLETYWIGDHGKRKASVLRQLHARGIQSIILAPPSEGSDPSPIKIPKNQYHTVTFGPDSLYPDLHVIQFDYYENLRMAWSKLQSAGHQRIGLTYQNRIGWRTNHSWLAAYLAEQKLAGISADEIPVMIQHGSSNMEELLVWAQETKIDALITPDSAIITAFQNSGLPVTAVSMHKSNSDVTGVDPNPEHAAFAALEILQFEMEHSLLKKSDFNLRIHIPGRWID